MLILVHRYSTFTSAKVFYTTMKQKQGNEYFADIPIGIRYQNMLVTTNLLNPIQLHIFIPESCEAGFWLH